MSDAYVKQPVPGVGKYLVVARYTFNQDGRYFIHRFRTDDIRDEAIKDVLADEVVDVLKLTKRPSIHLLTFNAKEENTNAQIPRA